MKPLKDYVEIIFAVLALAVLVFVFWYFIVAVPGETCGAVRDVCDGSGGGAPVRKGSVTGILKDT